MDTPICIYSANLTLRAFLLADCCPPSEMSSVRCHFIQTCKMNQGAATNGHITVWYHHHTNQSTYYRYHTHIPTMIPYHTVHLSSSSSLQSYSFSRKSMVWYGTTVPYHLRFGKTTDSHPQHMCYTPDRPPREQKSHRCSRFRLKQRVRWDGTMAPHVSLLGRSLCDLLCGLASAGHPCGWPTAKVVVLLLLLLLLSSAYW